jgi:hypothetical protein
MAPFRARNQNRTLKEPHVPFPPAAIFIDLELFATSKDCSSTSYTVLFGSNDHSIPVFPSPVAVRIIPAVTIVAERIQTRRAAIVFVLRFWKTIVTVVFLISEVIKFDDPFHKTVVMETSSRRQ